MSGAERHGTARPTELAQAAGCRVGVDLTPVAEVRDALRAFGERYTRRLFTDHEVASSGAAAESLAARFAAKEAALKVLEPAASRPPWRDIEVTRRPSGACGIRLHRRAASLAAARGLGPLSVSLSHEAGLAVAVVVALRPGPPDEATAEAAAAGDEPQGTRPTTDPAHARPNRRTGMTTTDDGTTRVREVLAAHARLPVDVATLGDDDDLFRAGMTSHASVNVMLALEDAFDVEFPEAMLRKATFASIGALQRALHELTAEEVPA